MRLGLLVGLQSESKAITVLGLGQSGVFDSCALHERGIDLSDMKLV